MARAEARLPGRAVALERGLWVGAAGRAARRAPRALAQIPRRRRARRKPRARRAAAAIGLGVSAAATWFLRVISDRTQRRFRDRVTIALESHVARLQASMATIEHHERPEYLDRLAMLRNQVFVLDHMYMSLFNTCGWILRLGVTLALLMSIHPALALLAVFALADGAYFDVAAGGGACGRRARCSRPIGWRGICSIWPRRRRPARKFV